MAIRLNQNFLTFFSPAVDNCGDVMALATMGLELQQLGKNQFW